MTAEEQLLFGIGYCLFIILIFWVVQKFLPKKINWYYGYRTRRSMANQKIWKAANEHSVATIIKFSVYSIVFPIVSYFIFPAFNVIITIVGNTLLIIASVILTENYLNQHFDSNGNPK